MKSRFVSGVLLCVLLSTMLFVKPYDTVVYASNMYTEGNKVDRAFWFDVVKRYNDNPDLKNESEYKINDFAFAIAALDAWKKYENTKATWNPLATTWKVGNWKDFNSKGVKSYTDRDSGIRGTAATISALNSANSYMWAIRKMLSRKGFDEANIKKALNVWTTGDASKSGGYVSDLVREWKNLYNGWKSTTIIGKGSGRCVDVDGWSRDNGAKIQIWKCGNSQNNQLWRLQKTGDYYLIISLNSGKCLDVSGSSRDNNAVVHQWDCHGGENQQWRLRKSGNYYEIVSRRSNKCLDVKDKKTGDGAALQQYDCWKGDNQLFKLTIP